MLSEKIGHYSRMLVGVKKMNSIQKPAKVVLSVCPLVVKI
jgi:hypothetical protein